MPRPAGSCTEYEDLDIPHSTPFAVSHFLTASSVPQVGFTCHRCKARSYRPVNPMAFEEGTLVVRCGKCQVWHKIRDHLGLFHGMAGDVFTRWAGRGGRNAGREGRGE